MSLQSFRNSVLLAALLILAACDPTGNSSFAGIEGTGSPTTVSGTVTAYGSIYVNGVHIDLNGAEVYIEGELASEQELQLGMVVDVITDAALPDTEQAMAQSVSYQRSLRGEVSQVLEVSDVRKVLKVLGQTLVVYDDAVFDGVSFEQLNVGSVVDVSGFVDAEGRLIASRLASTSDGDADVRGALRSLDPAQSRFELGELEVDYSEALFESGERDQLQEGTRVRLQGGELDNGVFRAHRVEILGERQNPDAGEASREGVIQNVESGAQFTLAGVPVDASEAVFVGGEGVQLQAGQRAVVSGEIRSGVLQAQSVQLLLPGVDRVRAVVDFVDPDTGELVLLGETYTSNRLTAFEDPARGNRFINMAEISQGDTVEVYARSAGELRSVTRIRRVDAGGQVELRGPVTSIDEGAQTVRVMNVNVRAEGEEAAQLLAELRQGERVKVRGALSDSDSILASEISLSSVPPGLDECPQPFRGDCATRPPQELDLKNPGGPRYRF